MSLSNLKAGLQTVLGELITRAATVELEPTVMFFWLTSLCKKDISVVKVRAHCSRLLGCPCATDRRDTVEVVKSVPGCITFTCVSPTLYLEFRTLK